MSFEQEWAEHKHRAVSQQSARTELDGAGAEAQPSTQPPLVSGPGSQNAMLASSPAEKNKAASYVEKHLAPDTKKAGATADDASGTVTGDSGGGTATPSPPLTGAAPQLPSNVHFKGNNGEFSDWATGKGLSYAQSSWGQQVNKLLARVNGELEGLRGANSLYQGQDTATGNTMSAAPDANGAPSSATGGPDSPLQANFERRSRISDY